MNGTASATTGVPPDEHEAIQGAKSAKIRSLNDRFRKSLTGGRVMMTAAVSALPDDVRARAIELTRTFDDFTPDNDPHNEHDFGSFEIDDQKFIFKHDYYDKSMQYGSEDPGDPQKTTRVLTIMLADETATPGDPIPPINLSGLGGPR